MLNTAAIKACEEQYEAFYSKIHKMSFVRYDYRDSDGKSFSITANTLEAARKKRDQWLIKGFLIKNT
jgi:hypothetical protein